MGSKLISKAASKQDDERLIKFKQQKDIKVGCFNARVSALPYFSGHNLPPLPQYFRLKIQKDKQNQTKFLITSVQFQNNIYTKVRYSPFFQKDVGVLILQNKLMDKEAYCQKWDEIYSKFKKQPKQSQNVLKIARVSLYHSMQANFREYDFQCYKQLVCFVYEKTLDTTNFQEIIKNNTATKYRAFQQMILKSQQNFIAQKLVYLANEIDNLEIQILILQEVNKEILKALKKYTSSYRFAYQPISNEDQNLCIVLIKNSLAQKIGIKKNQRTCPMKQYNVLNICRTISKNQKTILQNKQSFKQDFAKYFKAAKQRLQEDQRLLNLYQDNFYDSQSIFDDIYSKIQRINENCKDRKQYLKKLKQKFLQQLYQQIQFIQFYGPFLIVSASINVQNANKNNLTSYIDKKIIALKEMAQYIQDKSEIDRILVFGISIQDIKIQQLKQIKQSLEALKFKCVVSKNIQYKSKSQNRSSNQSKSQETICSPSFIISNQNLQKFQQLTFGNAIQNSSIPSKSHPFFTKIASVTIKAQFYNEYKISKLIQEMVEFKYEI